MTATSKTGIGLASATRGIAFLNNGNVINYVTMASTGAGQDFGDNEIAKGAGGSGCASPTRGIFVDGDAPASGSETIAFITIATLGDAQDFGDLSIGRKIQNPAGSCASSTRGVIAGGYDFPAFLNIIDYVTIQSTGDALDFGDLIIVGSSGAGLSNGHGGLG